MKKLIDYFNYLDYWFPIQPAFYYLDELVIGG